MERYIGKWQNTKNENFDEWLEYKKVWPFLRQVSKATTTYMDIQEIGERNYHIRVYVVFQTFHDVKFELGKTVDARSAMGQKITNTYRIENGTLMLTVVELECDDLTEEYTHTLEDDDTLILCMPLGDGQQMCKRLFVKC